MSTLAASPATADAIELLGELFAGIEPHDFDVRLWDGTRWTPAAGRADSAFTLVVNRPSALRRVILAGDEAALAEAYLGGSLDLEGDIFAVPPVGRALVEHHRGIAERARLALHARRLPHDEDARPGDLHAADLHGRAHSLSRDREAVTHHYDVSNRFYTLFLDPRLVYSCATFRHPDDDLESAQLRKLDLICRKLRIREGDRLLDIGCGWGALIIHAVRAYGATALGITLSERQAEFARERIARAGLADRCTVEIRDYRTLERDGAFDRIASIGMFEHVGRDRAPEYFRTIHRMLRPGGAYLHHAITANALRPPVAGATLSNRYVFPDHELIPIGETLVFAERAGFDVRDVENLREHYALTLRRWIAALERNHDEAAAEAGEPTWRAWHLTFAGAALDFECGKAGLLQALFIKPDKNGSADVPLGRWDWYENP